MKLNPRINETRMQHCGMECTIIAWTTAKDITVKFTDGTVVAHRSYQQFKNGYIRNPELQHTNIASHAEAHINQVHMQNCGMACQIIQYPNCHHMTVKFADGIIVPYKSYNDFTHGNIQHPYMKLFKINNNRQPVYQTKHIKYYNATCPLCHYNYILTIGKMSEHIQKFHPEVVEYLNT